VAGSYLRSLQLAKQLEQKAKEASNKKAEAEGKLQKAEAILEFCKKINAETDEIEKILAETVATLESRDFDLAQAKAAQAVNTAKNIFIAKIRSILDGAEEIVTLISEVGGEPEQLKKLKSDTNSALEDENFEKSMKLAEQTWDASQKALHEHYANAYSRAQQILLKAKKQGEEVEDLESDLRGTKSQIDSENYTAAMSALKNVIETASELLSSRISSELDSIEDSILSAEDLGAATDRIKENLSKARELLKSGDFDEATSIAKRAESECEKTISGKLHKEMRALREEIRATKKRAVAVDEMVDMLDEASKAAKEHEITSAIRLMDKARSALKEAQFQVVLQAIARSRDRFILSNKLDIDISGAITLLNEARKKLRKGRFEEAINAADEAETEIETALSAFNQAKESMEKLTKLGNDVEMIGLELPSDMNFFQEAKEALADKDFVKVAQRAGAGINAINKLARRAAEEEVGSAEDIIAIIGQLKVKASDAKNLLKIAYENLDMKNYVEAYKTAVKSVDTSKQAAQHLFENNISSLSSFLDDLSGALDVTEHKAQLDSAQQLFEQSNFAEAFDRLGEIKNAVMKKGIEECRNLIGDAEIGVNELEAAGIDAADLRLMTTKAEELFQQKMYEDAAATAKEALQDANSKLESLAKESLFTLKESLKDAHADSIDTSKWRAFFKQAKKLLDAGDNSSSYQITKKVLDEIKEATRARREVLTKIERCWELVAEAKENRIDVAAFSKEIEDAKNALNTLEIKKATSFIEKAERNIENAMAMYLAAKLILALKSSLEFAERESLSVDTADNTLKNAKILMKERKYDEALDAAKQAQREITEVVKERALSKISDIQTLIADARNVGVDVSRPTKLLEKSQAEINEGDYETSLKSILLAENEIDQIKDLSSKSAIEIRIARERIRDAESIGLDMNSSRMTLDQAIDSLNSHKYAISFELSRKSGAQALEVIRISLESLFETLAGRITTADEQGAEINTAESILAESRKAFGRMEFQDSIGLIMQCEQELDRADLQYNIALNSLEVAKSRLQEAEGDGLQVTRAKEILEDANGAMTEKQFAKVIEFSIALGDEIEHIKHRMENCHLDLNALEERLDRLRRVGLEINLADEHLKSSEKALQNGDFVTCREKCIEGERAISIELEKIIQDKIELAERLIETGVLLGVRDREYRDMLAVAQTSAGEGLWDFAVEEIQKCIAELGKIIGERLRKSIEEIRSKITIIKKTEASVAMIEEKLQAAETEIDGEEFEKAFKAVVDAEGLISSVESLHKEYLDVKYAAESAIAVAKKFGIPTKESDRLLAMAEIEQEKDYASAIELAREAAESARSSLEQFNPDLVLSIEPEEFTENQPGKITVKITNQGKALAKDLTLDVSDNVEAKELSEVPQIRGGETKGIEIEIISPRSGEIELSVIVTAKRLFDGKSFEFSGKAPITVTPSEPTARLARATGTAKCVSCNGKIKAGFDIVICNRCQRIQHLACAKRNMRCGNCSALLVFE